jgi:large subunit ribosomal protein L5
MSRLQQHYREKVVPELTEKFGYKSPMQVPRITKITLNMGVSEAVADKKVMDNAVGDLTKIAGQKPVVTKAKKAIAGFKIREQQAIGTMVTLRGARMYEFLDRFVTVALPRVRDFRGVSGRAFDGRGNYNRRQGTDHLPGDRVRQGRRAARPEHLDHHDGEDRRRSQGAACRLQIPVQELKVRRG